MPVHSKPALINNEWIRGGKLVISYKINNDMKGIIGINLLKLFLTDEELARLELIGKENNPCRVALELNIPVDCN